MSRFQIKLSATLKYIVRWQKEIKNKGIGVGRALDFYEIKTKF